MLARRFSPPAFFCGIEGCSPHFFAILLRISYNKKTKKEKGEECFCLLFWQVILQLLRALTKALGINYDKDSRL